MPAPGPILDADSQARYEERLLSLGPGDALLLYTDGLTEAGPNGREFLGAGGLANLLQASRVQDKTFLLSDIIAGVQSCAQAVLRDGACLLTDIVLQRPGSSKEYHSGKANMRP
jgi:sigma-B regulation protein RsbU (phosphoserine phosphatase)